uniref:Astacin domain-containing protein n=1 Tax=Parastrongyloides trichosuri TaxID=131310 RepID=A0A0N4Z1K7_PARTI
YGSLMHYPGSSYISNFKPYMLAKNVDPYNKMMGQSYRLSFNDFKLLNLYFCSKNCLGSEHKCKNGGYLHWIQCGTCICPKGFQGRDCGYIKPISHYCNETILVASREEKILSLEKIRHAII